MDQKGRAERPDPVVLYGGAAAGEKAEAVVASLVLAVVKPMLGAVGRRTFAPDDTPTQRYGPHVQPADAHHNSTPGPA